MLAVIWRYSVADENVAAFEHFYGAGGAWEALFLESPDFLGTELLRGEDGAYVTIDRWTGADAYDGFLRDRRTRYDEIDATCDRLTTSETLVGRFTETAARPASRRPE